MNRRSLIKNLGGIIVAPSLLEGTSLAAKPIRIAHLTDIHLKDKFDAPARFRKCLHHVQSQRPGVDMILNGGDIVFDMNKENLSTIDAQWNLWNSVMKADCSLPVHSVLGNHDVWWNEDDKGQMHYGKKYSLDKIGLAKPYYSFEKGGWKFLMLDSVHLDVDNTWYIGRLGEEQTAWLANELAATAKTTPICILSHIPILSATVLIQDKIVNRREIQGGDMHTDSSELIDLFYRYPNVKLCLSGHQHLRDKLIYNDVTYICNGAVSGAWWEGDNRQTGPGYGVIDLYPDGSFSERYIKYDGPL